MWLKSISLTDFNKKKKRKKNMHCSFYLFQLCKKKNQVTQWIPSAMLELDPALRIWMKEWSHGFWEDIALKVLDYFNNKITFPRKKILQHWQMSSYILMKIRKLTLEHNVWCKSYESLWKTMLRSFTPFSDL